MLSASLFILLRTAYFMVPAHNCNVAPEVMETECRDGAAEAGADYSADECDGLATHMRNWCAQQGVKL